jgi:hypothetical protein
MENILKAHRAVLIGESHKLIFLNFYPTSIKSIFFTAHSLKFAGVLAKDAPEIVKINDFKFEVMSKVLDFLHTGKLEVAPDDVADLFNCAKKFKIHVLKMFLLDQPKELINIENFLDFYLEAKSENLKELQENSLKFFGG